MSALAVSLLAALQAASTHPAVRRWEFIYTSASFPSAHAGMVSVSRDGGRSWSPAQRLPSGIIGPVKNNPVWLPDGTVISPSSTESPDPKPLHHPLRTPPARVIIGEQYPLGGVMKKQFVVPVLREEAALAQLTLNDACSNCDFDD